MVILIYTSDAMRCDAMGGWGRVVKKVLLLLLLLLCLFSLIFEEGRRRFHSRYPLFSPPSSSSSSSLFFLSLHPKVHITAQRSIGPFIIGLSATERERKEEPSRDYVSDCGIALIVGRLQHPKKKKKERKK